MSVLYLSYVGAIFGSYFFWWADGSNAHREAHVKLVLFISSCVRFLRGEQMVRGSLAAVKDTLIVKSTRCSSEDGNLMGSVSCSPKAKKEKKKLNSIVKES